MMEVGAISLFLRGITAFIAVFIIMTLFTKGVSGASLPEENAAVSFHHYSGDDTNINSSRLLVRKHINNQYGLSFSQIYESTDNGTEDVRTQASSDEYSENRNETNLGFDFLNNGTLLLVKTSYSDEADYQASTLQVDITQEVFGNTTTFGFGFSRGWDVVGRVDTQTEWDLDGQNFRFLFSQAMSKSWVSQLSYEHTSEQGYLGSPYLAARQQGTLVTQRLPATRIQHSVAFTNRLYFLARSVAVLNYRYFTDSWNIKAHTLAMTHIKPIEPLWELDLYYRFYRQNAASFYFDNADQTYLYISRDKILSQFNQHSIGITLSYDWGKNLGDGFENVSLNGNVDFMRFNYDNYTHVESGEAYQFDALSIQFYLSWRF